MCHCAKRLLAPVVRLRTRWLTAARPQAPSLSGARSRRSPKRRLVQGLTIRQPQATTPPLLDRPGVEDVPVEVAMMAPPGLASAVEALAEVAVGAPPRHACLVPRPLAVATQMPPNNLLPQTRLGLGMTHNLRRRLRRPLNRRTVAVTVPPQPRLLSAAPRRRLVHQGTPVALLRPTRVVSSRPAPRRAGPACLRSLSPCLL